MGYNCLPQSSNSLPNELQVFEPHPEKSLSPDELMIQRQPTFLIVDDRPNMLQLMSNVLKSDGRVHTAENGAEALRALVCEPIDVVLCDLRMPDMDGLAVLKAAKRLRPEVEFVLMTALASVGTAVEALRLGAHDYLTKPFDPAHARDVLLRATYRLGSAGEEADEVHVANLPSEASRRDSRAEEDALFAAMTWEKAVDYGREQTAKCYLEAVLRRFDGKISLAAKHAEIERESFYRLLRKHQVDPAEFRTTTRGAKS